MDLKHRHKGNCASELLHDSTLLALEVYHSTPFMSQETPRQQHAH